ncbi:MAG TPA: hypothetical protein VGW35_24890 [Methylomirabilota bacterium]|jgi:hypothetical protein|nr:hypothetical protein [Methylomirabilota bacterium]
MRESYVVTNPARKIEAANTTATLVQRGGRNTVTGASLAVARLCSMAAMVSRMKPRPTDASGQTPNARP